MTDNLAILRDKIEADERATLETWRKHSGATHTSRELFKNYENAARAAKMAANGAQSKVERLRADDLMNPEGRRRLVREALEQGRAEVKKHQDRMEASLDVLKAELSQAAVLRVDPKRESPAREELRMLLDGAADPVAAMIDCAQRDDELGAVCASSYGESYLRGRGIPDARAAHESVRSVAVACAAKSTDPIRRAAGEARAEFGSLEKSRDATQYFTNTALEAAKEAGAGL